MEQKQKVKESDLGEWEITKNIPLWYSQNHISEDDYLKIEGKAIAIAKLLKKKNRTRKNKHRNNYLQQEIDQLLQDSQEFQKEAKENLTILAKAITKRLFWMAEIEERKSFGYQRMTDIQAGKYQALLDALGKSKHSKTNLFPTHSIYDTGNSRLFFEDEIFKPKNNIGKTPKKKDRPTKEEIIQDFKGFRVRPKEILQFYGIKKTNTLKHWVSYMLKKNFPKQENRYFITPDGKDSNPVVSDITLAEDRRVLFDYRKYKAEKVKVLVR